MKNSTLTLKIFALSLFVGLVFTSCQGDDEINTFTKNPIAVEDAQVIADGDEVTEGITDLVDQLYLEDGLFTNRMEFNSFLPNCGVRTVKWDAAEVMKTVTVEFGDGCTLANGNIVKGKIVIVFNKNRNLLSHTVTVTYHNFYFNNKKVEGSTFVERLLANANGNPQSTVKIDLKITFADGLFIERKSERVREMIAGKDTPGIWVIMCF